MRTAKTLMVVTVVMLAMLAFACGGPEPTATSILGATSTPSPTVTVKPTSTPTPTPTPVPTPTPTSTPTPTQDPFGGFFLAIESPEDVETVVATDSIEVAGRTRVDAVVTVNDAVVDVDLEGRFSHTVQLEEGPNIIEVVSSIEDGEELSEVLVVIYVPGG